MILQSILFGGVLLFLFLLLVLVESTVLQWLRWEDLRGSWIGAVKANLASVIPAFGFLALVPRFGTPAIIISLAVSIIIEGVVLARLKPELKRLGWVAIGIANLASYCILIIPTFLFSLND